MKDSMKRPNIFDYATSELSQDATLAYILSWAKPEYSSQYPELHKLGTNLLRAMVAACNTSGCKEFSLDDNTPIEKLEIGTQVKHIDVRVKINDQFLLIIEDKTYTIEHSDQIARYISEGKKGKTSSGEPWKVMAIYVKTGNESISANDGNKNCGIFMRSDILNILDTVAQTNNDIIEEFRQHLKQWQTDTESFITTSYLDWSKSAIQGYYMALKQHIDTRYNVNCVWNYVPNPSGGFQCFWWHRQVFEARRCCLYLQIENGYRLQIRVSDAQDESGNGIKANCPLMWSILGDLEKTSELEEFKQIIIRKAGRFGGGQWAGVADILFDDGSETYLGIKHDGNIDMAAIQNRLDLLMRFVDKVCGDAVDKTTGEG